MNILIAFSDRDMTACYEALFALRGDSAVSVRDATQIPARAKRGETDVAVIDETLPHADTAKAIEHLRGKGIRTVVAKMKAPDLAELTGAGAADAYIEYPFRPEDLFSVTDGLAALGKNGGTVPLGDAVADAAYMIMGNERLTLDEIRFVSCLASGQKPEVKNTGLIARSLNRKLERENRKARIVYRTGTGYGVVISE
ncbi:MAG: hypothetical protein IKX86_03695 [Clostridia bacterium]|nr:hypothetical protein [Clostridia bacterium]